MNNNVQSKLNEQLVVRNSRLFYTHVFVLIVSPFVFKVGAVNFYPLMVVFVSLVARILILKKYRTPILLYTFFAATTGLGWAIFFSIVYKTFGLTSIQSMVCLGFILILLSGGVTAFSVHLPSCYAYFVSLVVIPAWYCFNDPGELSYILGIMFSGTLLYHFYHAKLSHDLTRQLISAEQAANTQRENLQEFINAIPGLVAVVDKDEKFSMVNNNFDGFFKDAVGKDLKSFYPESAITKCLLSFLRGSEEEKLSEVNTIFNGEESWFTIHLRRLHNPVEGIVASIQPITELIKAKNDLRIQESRSQYTAKLASLGEFSAGIAHEVNNPLTIIEGSVSYMNVLLQDDKLDRSSLKKVADKISETTNRIAKIIRGLRTLSGNAEEEPFSNVSFDSIIEPALEICRPKLSEHNIRVSFHEPDEKVELFGNEIQLSQVIMNLISNAIDAVKDQTENRWIEIHYHPQVEWIDILVVDSGAGVEEKIREKIMNPFFTTKVSNQGTGLGLSISKTIVENHQGTLEYLVGRPNSTFRIRFPRMNLWAKKMESSEEKISAPE